MPILFTEIGRWWGTNRKTHTQEEIDLIAKDGDRYLFCECKWRNERLEDAVLKKLEERADIFCAERKETWYVLFSKSGFSEALKKETEIRKDLLLIEARDMC